MKGTKASINAEYLEYSQILKKSEQTKVERAMVLPETLEAPVKKGDIIGSVVYKIGNKELGKTDILASESVERLNFGNAFLLLLQKCAQIF